MTARMLGLVRILLYAEAFEPHQSPTYRARLVAIEGYLLARLLRCRPRPVYHLAPLRLHRDLLAARQRSAATATNTRSNARDS